MSKNPSHPNLVWVDFETTGLDPQYGKPLEVAVVLTTPNLDTIAQLSYVVGWELDDLPLSSLSPFILEMHSANGLLDEVYNSDDAMAISWIDTVVCDVISQSYLVGDTKPPLAGSTISFDRAWLQKWMPRTNEAVHYRNLDVSTFKEAAQRWWPDAAYPSPDVEVHRALPDIHESIDAARHYRKVLFGA